MFETIFGYIGIFYIMYRFIYACKTYPIGSVEQ